MPPKRSRGPEGIIDKKVPSILEVRVQPGASVNEPVGVRIGHTSYVNLSSGLLHVIGGCDVASLPEVLLVTQGTKSKTPIPLVETWDVTSRKWLTGKSEEENDSEMEEGQVNETPLADSFLPNDTQGRFSPADTCTTLLSGGPNDIVWPTLAGLQLYWKPIQGDGSIKSKPTLAVSPRGVCINSQGPDEKGKMWPAEGSSTATQSTSTGFTDTAPTVFFVGGWRSSKYSRRSRAIDLCTGAIVPIRGTMSSSASGLACATATVARGKLYVFGGNNGAGCMSHMEKIDLTTYRWMERGTLPKIDLPSTRPHPRSSHVAGLLFDRYIVIYGGRQSNVSADPLRRKSRKGTRKADSGPSHALTIEFEFCNDVAVYDVESERWVITSLLVNHMGPEARYGHAACAVSPSELFIHGGIGVGGKILSDAWILQLEREANGVAVSWIKLKTNESESDQLPCRCLHSLASCGMRRVYISGGLSSKEEGGDVWIVDIDDLCLLVSRASTRRPDRRSQSGRRVTSK